MLIDVVSIFPDYLAPLDLSLIGTARRNGLIDLRVHDLRDFTRPAPHRRRTRPTAAGRHGDAARAVGGGARPRPRRGSPRGAGRPSAPDRPGPGGLPFTQAMARDLAAQPWLAFACGRYEGIDERVYDEAREHMPVSVVSLGDYVLNGGEVAVLAMVEAIARLVPGVIGNAESLVEESHEDGLLEYPVYTKPRCGAGAASRRSSSRGTMPPSPAGGATSASGAPRSAAQT